MQHVRVAITGAAGQISYSLAFRIASGEVFGPQTKVHLHLLELPVALKAAEGVAMELEDCAFPTLGSINCFDSPEPGFTGIDWALMVGAKPRGPGMERGDLIRENGPIFVAQGKALNKANAGVKTVVVGNPCNTNALIAMHAAKDVPAQRFTAMTALDEARAKAQLAKKAKVDISDVSGIYIWGNHSPTMYPDYENAKIQGRPATSVIQDESWFKTDFLRNVQQRGSEIIAARGKSSAASAASACIDHVKALLTPGKIFSCAVPSDGKHYDIPRGLIYSVPVEVLKNSEYRVVESISLSVFAKAKVKASADELLSERTVVQDLLG